MPCGGSVARQSAICPRVQIIKCIHDLVIIHTMQLQAQACRCHFDISAQGMQLISGELVRCTRQPSALRPVILPW